MKKKFLFVLTILTTVSFSVFSDGIGDGGREGLHIAKSFSAGASVEIDIQDNVIESYFNSDLGVVTITIDNSRGISFVRKSVYTEVERTATVNISNLPAGVYTVLYKDKSGNTIKSQSFNKN